MNPSFKLLLIAIFTLTLPRLSLGQLSVAEDVVWKDLSPGLAASYSSPGTGSSLKRTAASTSAWDADAVSNKYLFGDGYIEWKFAVTNKRVMVGLASSDPNATYTSLRHAFYVRSDGVYEIREDGANPVGSPTGTVTTSKVFRIERQGSRIKYFVYTQGSAIGSPIYTSATGSQGALLVDTSFYDQNAEIIGCHYFGEPAPEDVLWAEQVDTAASHLTGGAGSALSKSSASTGFDADAVSGKAITMLRLISKDTWRKCSFSINCLRLRNGTEWARTFRGNTKSVRRLPSRLV